nr:helix-turn-helix domain-containing protein [Frankia sp. Cas3]
MQEHNRAKVLTAARKEFAERGFREAKIDAIAERAELTRGAVYSNFPGKRALYFAVLAEDAERWVSEYRPDPGRTSREALGEFARAWVARSPLTTDDTDAAWLGRDLIPEVLADDQTRRAFAQLMSLSALLLGLSLEGMESGRRRVHTAEAALTTLYGASQLAAAAPGFVDPFNVISTCEQLADLEFDDVWEPPHLPYVAPARPTNEPWAPPPATDALSRQPAPLTGDGIVAVLGLHRVGAVEEAVRAAPSGVDITVAIVSGAPYELAPLTRLVVAELRTCLHQAFPGRALPPLRVVIDDSGSLATAAGVHAVSDATEVAVRLASGRIVARSEGHGACHAAASVENPGPPHSGRRR